MRRPATVLMAPGGFGKTALRPRPRRTRERLGSGRGRPPERPAPRRVPLPARGGRRPPPAGRAERLRGRARQCSRGADRGRPALLPARHRPLPRSRVSRRQLAAVADESGGWPIALRIGRNAAARRGPGETRVARHVVDNWIAGRFRTASPMPTGNWCSTPPLRPARRRPPRGGRGAPRRVRPSPSPAGAGRPLGTGGATRARRLPRASSDCWR